MAARGDQKRHLGQAKQFSLRELQVATDNFSERNIIGRGAFGKIYRGTLANRSLVAVKRKEERTHIGELQFQTEVHILSMVIHRNILRLHGFCKTRKEMLLVYAFMANGSVGSRLRGNLYCLIQSVFSSCILSSCSFVKNTINYLLLALIM